MMSSLTVAAVVWLSALSLATCGAPPPQSPDVRTSQSQRDVLTIEVAPRTVACTGEAPQRCLLVRTEPGAEWTYFYDPIQGFAYEEGYRYRIEVERQPVPNPPADGSSFTYRLRRVLSKERA